jgi:hypothetical protein
MSVCDKKNCNKPVTFTCKSCSKNKCNAHRECYSTEICWKCKQGLEDDFRLLLSIPTTTPETISNQLDNPNLDKNGLYFHPLAWAMVNGNIHITRALLDDPRIQFRDDGIIPAIVKGQTETIKMVLADPRRKSSYDFNDYLVYASLMKNDELVHILLNEYNIDKKYLAEAPKSDNDPYGVLCCIKCEKPTQTFLISSCTPLCEDCVKTPENFCMYCRNRKYSGDISPVRCSLHNHENLLFKWDNQTKSFTDGSNNKHALCFMDNCKNIATVWSQYKWHRNDFELMCTDCFQRKGRCWSCIGSHDNIFGPHHTCENTFDLRNGFFYLNR